TTAWKSALLVPQNFSPIVGQGWTLVHEVKFYAIFGLLLLFPRAVALRIAFAWAAVSAAVLGLIPRLLDNRLICLADEGAMEEGWGWEENARN
ncbi:MAG: hypothetical protein SF070_15155, partial [Gemmatimonadota bacterium]|nr:hypothetical protein [Gemmatimonadota bacterium]